MKYLFYIKIWEGSHMIWEGSHVYARIPFYTEEISSLQAQMEIELCIKEQL